MSLLLWSIPLLRPIALPLIYLNTHIHELCHALVAIGTSGHVEHILVFGNGSGVTPVVGGSLILTASAGYVGSSLVGGALIVSSRKAKNARIALWVLFVSMALSMLLFVRGDLIGWISGLLWAGTLAVLAKTLKEKQIVFAGQFLGLQLVLTCFQAFLVLMQISVISERQSDAMILAQLTGLPAILWASIWLILGILVVWGSLFRAWKPERHSR